MHTPDIKRALKNKVVLISGSSRGIGRECARYCTRYGAKVMLHGRNRATLQQVHQELAATGAIVATAVGDITHAPHALRIINRCVEVYQRIDILINNAGLSMRGSFGQCVPEVFKKMVEINLLGTTYLTQYALPHIIKQHGSIVLVSSGAGMYGFPNIIAYSMAKMALNALYQGLRAEQPQITTGITYLDFVENDKNKHILSATAQKIALTRRPTMSQVQAAASIIKCAISGGVVYGTSTLQWFALVSRLCPPIASYIARKKAAHATHSATDQLPQ